MGDDEIDVTVHPGGSDAITAWPGEDAGAITASDAEGAPAEEPADPSDTDPFGPSAEAGVLTVHPDPAGVAAFDAMSLGIVDGTGRD